MEHLSRTQLKQSDQVIESAFILHKIRVGKNITPSRMPSVDYMREFVEKKDSLGHKRNGTSKVGSHGV